MDYLVGFAVLLLAAVCSAQGQPTPMPENPCARAGRMAVSGCFLNNGGFQMNTVLAILFNGTRGQPLPPNAEQIRQSMCQNQRQIIQCIFQNVRSFNNSQQCGSLVEFLTLEQNTVGLLNGLQQICGSGIMPQLSRCMRNLNVAMGDCYDEAGLNRKLFAPGSSQMQGAVIGDNREIASLFCSNRRKLFSCHNRVLKDCPNAKQLQVLSGYDQDSMQQGIDVLCKDIDVYVSGLVCFQTPTPQVQACADDMVRRMTDITVEQLEKNLPADQFFQKYCELRIDNLDCDFVAWKKTCPSVSVGLKNEFQCSLLPARCKSDPSLSDHISKTCAAPHFHREERQTGNSAPPSGQLSSALLTVLTFGVILLI